MTRRRRPVAMLVHSYYEEDPRVRRQAETLVRAGHDVDVFSLRRPGDEPAGILEGVRVTRLDVQRHQGSPIATYLAEYSAFLARATLALLRAHRRRRYGLVQVHTPPDFLVFAALPLRLVAGVPVLLDLHEATPEFFRSRWPGVSNRLTIGALTLVERCSAAVAGKVLSVNQARHERLVRLGIPERKLAVVPNGPSLARFDPGAHPKRAFMADGVLRLAYAGALTPLYGLDDVIAALAILRRERPDLPVVLDIYGRGDMADALAARATELGVGDAVVFHGRIGLDEVAPVLAAADVVLSPIRRNRFSEISLSTKVYEGAVMGKPVVAADLPAARAEFPGDVLAWYEPDDPAALARAILRPVMEPAWRDGAVPVAAALARDLAWDAEAPRYRALVEGMMRDRGSA